MRSDRHPLQRFVAAVRRNAHGRKSVDGGRHLELPLRRHPVGLCEGKPLQPVEPRKLFAGRDRGRARVRKRRAHSTQLRLSPGRDGIRGSGSARRKRTDDLGLQRFEAGRNDSRSLRGGAGRRWRRRQVRPAGENRQRIRRDVPARGKDRSDLPRRSGQVLRLRPDAEWRRGHRPDQYERTNRQERRSDARVDSGLGPFFGGASRRVQGHLRRERLIPAGRLDRRRRAPRDHQPDHGDPVGERFGRGLRHAEVARGRRGQRKDLRLLGGGYVGAARLRVRAVAVQRHADAGGHVDSG